MLDEPDKPRDFAYQQMYCVCAQDPDDDCTQRAYDVSGVFERTWHGQYSRAQAGLEQMYKCIEISIDRRQKNQSVSEIAF